MRTSQLPEFIRDAAEVSMPAGSQVFGQGDRAENYLLVTQGSVKVFARSDEGREVVLYRVRPGEMCTLTTACLLGHTSYPAEAVAESETTARAVPAVRFAEMIEESAEFREFVFSSLSGRLNEIMQRFEQLVLASVDKKLAGYLVKHADADGVVQTTHENLALEIGTAREVVSRHLKSLESRGLLELQRGRIRLLDAGALRGLV